MKKTLLLLASAALLLVGCAKEKLGPDAGSGEMVTANFSVQVQGKPQTKSVTDDEETKANRCVMEIYYKGELYTRDVQPISKMFTPKLVSNRTYDVLFWADCGEGLADKYYTTNAEGGLQAVEMVSTSYAANDDARDAFFTKEKVTVGQQVSSETFTLTRPFSQVNVITTDAAVIKNDNLYPDGVKMVYTAPTKFNLMTGELSKEKKLTVTGTPYEALVTTSAALTLEMDYLFTGKDKSALDIAFEASKTGESTVTSHSFTNIPVQRNYRTNIKGALLTTTGQWTVTVEPTWTDPEYTHPVVIATTLAEAQAALGPDSSETEAAGTVIVKPEAVMNRDQSKDKDSEYIETNTPGIELPDGAKAIEFVLTPQSKKDVTFELPALPSEDFYWYIRHEEGYPTENLNIKVDSNDATRVIVDAPDDTHVVLNDVVYAHVVAITGENTLVVPQGITVQKLTVKKGGVEIHGTVAELEITGTKEDVFFRACEGLIAGVFEKIYKESDNINFIDPMYAYKRVGDNYDIYKLPVVAMIGKKEYPSIAAAVAAVPANNTELVTIKVMSDVVINSSSLSINKNNVVLDGQGHTIAIDETDTSLEQYLVGGANGKYGGFQMIKVSGNDITLKNLILDSKNYRGASLATTNGGKNVSYENIVYKGLGSGHYYGTAGGDGTLKFKNCTFETHGYAIHTAESSTVLEVSDCEIHGWVSYGDKTKSATFTNTNFYSTEDVNNGVIATIRPYCATTITNCTFSKEYLVKYKYDGLTVRKNVVVSLNGCSVEEGELCDIANITCPDDPWIDGGVMAINATGNATDGFTAGTFVAKQASDIKVAGLNEVVPVEGKENVYTIVPKQLDENTVAVLGATEYSSFEAAMQAALDAKGGTITLVKDVTLAKGWDHGANIGDNRDKYSFVLNLNGKTIFRGPNNYHISLCDNDWTVIDETGEGTINKASDGTSNLTLWCANGHDPFFSKMAKLETCPVFILNGGTYSADGDFSNPWNRKYGVDFQAGGTGDNHMAICKFLLNNATIRNMRILNGQGEIKGGTISGQILFDIDDTRYTQFGIQNSDLYTIISGGVFTLDATKPFIFQNHFTASNLKIKGGTFNFNPSVNYSACIPAGYTSQDNGDGTWTVVEEN